MADLTVTRAVLENGTLTITGTGFTRTTTFVEIDGNQLPFELSEAGEIKVSNVPEGASEVDITKGDVTETADVEQSGPTGGEAGTSSSESGEAGSGGPYDPGGDVHEEGYKTATPNQTPGDLVEDDLKTQTDVSTDELATAGNAGAEAKSGNDPNAPNRTPLQQGQHLPGKDFRTQVENTAAGDLNMDPREPYPTGNPPDPRESFHRMHGYYKEEEGDGQPEGRSAEGTQERSAQTQSGAQRRAESR
jgi:hypothetical protein